LLPRRPPSLPTRRSSDLPGPTVRPPHPICNTCAAATIGSNPTASCRPETPPSHRLENNTWSRERADNPPRLRGERGRHVLINIGRRTGRLQPPDPIEGPSETTN